MTRSYPHYYTALYTPVTPCVSCLDNYRVREKPTMTTEETTALWKNVLKDMEQSVSRANFLTLFKHTYLLSLEDGIATIAAPSTMIIDLLQKRFQEEVKRSLDLFSKQDVAILFVVKSIPGPESDQDESPPESLFAETSVTTKKPSIGHLPRVRPDFTFENFAVSGSNQLAFVSSQRVAELIGVSYNPFFLYGPVGVGKTHLMHAIANSVYQKDPGKKIIYIPSEEFTNEVVEAIRTNETARMKKRFRSAFLLLIDDIQFIEGKERVQEELFHTFNILIDNKSQIVLSSDRPPHEIKRLEKRLSSRFAGGLTVDIEQPDFELKTAILLIKAKKYGYELPIEVAKLLAERAEDTRSLEGLLLRVVTQATASNSQITEELAQQSLGRIAEEKRSHVHSEDIIAIVCEYFGVKGTQLKGPKREASLVRARQISMYLLKHELGLTLVEIGNMLGGRDHTTVMHGVGKIEALLSNNPHVTEDIRGITSRLHG